MQTWATTRGATHFVRRGPPRAALLAALRVCLLTRRELARLDGSTAAEVRDPRRGALSVRNEERVSAALAGLLQGMLLSDEIAAHNAAEAAAEAAEAEAAAAQAVAAAGGGAELSGGEEEEEEEEEEEDADERKALEAAIEQLVTWQERVVHENLEVASLLHLRAEVEFARERGRAAAREGT